MPDLKELDVVSLREDLPAEGLKKGMRGTILTVYVHPKPEYEVEFCDKCGRTIAQLALTPDQIILNWPYPGSTT